MGDAELPLPTIEVPSPAGPRAPDRRESIRLDAQNGSVAGFSGPFATQLPKVAEVHDMSEGGLRLVFDWSGPEAFPLNPGDNLGFSLKLEDCLEVFDLLARATWVRQRAEDSKVDVGVQFCGLDEETSGGLKRAMVNMAFGDVPPEGETAGPRSKRGRPPSSANIAIESTRPRRRKLFLGEILVRQGALDAGRLKRFLDREYSGERPLGEELARQGLVDDRSIARALAEQHRLSFLDLGAEPPDEELVRTLPRAAFERHGGIPLREEAGALLVAIGCRPTLQLVEDLKASLGRRVRLCIAPEGQLADWRRRLYPLRYWDLVDRGLVSQEQLESAQDMAAAEATSLESALTSAFKVAKKDLLASLGRYFGCGVYEYDPYGALPIELRAGIYDRYELLRSIGVAPVDSDDGRVVVAMADPNDRVAREKVKAVFAGRRIDVLAAVPEDVLAALDRFFGLASSADSGVGEILQELSEGQAPAAWDGETEDIDPGIREDDSAVVRLLNRIIEDARAKGASDIHIEPSRDTGVVRYRVDGVLHRAMTFPAQYRSAIISRVKVMSDLDIAERRRPQSGKIRFRRWGGLDLELRVETFPSVGGYEDAVLRILTATVPRTLDDIGMSTHNLSEMKRLSRMPYGLVLCVGPTGSGKTTTLHSVLGYLNSEDVKILTAEDPVEITQPGLRQLQVNVKAGITFASALRSFLRSDPDVIMIGEMRDRETASIAVEASMTGHLVLSTLHTNSAPETIVRLLDMGIDPYSFADALLGVLAQRLVRTLCGDCRRPRPVGEDTLRLLRQEFGNDAAFDSFGFVPESQMWHSARTGCDACHGSGHRGRMAIHELLSCTDRIREMIYRRAAAIEIRRAAMDEGMRTLKQDGIAKVLAGATTLEEVRAACSR